MNREIFPSSGFLKYLESIPVDFNPDKRLTELTTEMENHQGEFVLVVTRNWKRGVTCGLNPEHYTLEETAYLGILTPPFVQGDHFDFKVMTPKHILIDFDRRVLTPKLVNGPIEGWGIVKDFLELPLEKKSKEEVGILAFKEPPLALEIIVGDEKVRGWFEGKTRESLSEEKKMLQIEKPELFQKYFGDQIRIEPLVAFAKAAEILGRPLIGVPKEAREFIEKHKLSIVSKLLALRQKEDKILAKLAKIQGIKAPKLGDGIHFADVDQATEEDFEDLKIIESIQPTKELNSVRRQIKSTIEQAFEFNLHKTDWKITQELQPGVTQEVNIKRLIHDLCQFYEIPIPQ